MLESHMMTNLQEGEQLGMDLPIIIIVRHFINLGNPLRTLSILHWFQGKRIA